MAVRDIELEWEEKVAVKRLQGSVGNTKKMNIVMMKKKMVR